MNWEMLTAIGQLATVCVGVPSIIYFAIQLNEQTRERRQSAVNALTVQWGDLTKALHENAEFTALFLRGVQSFHVGNTETLAYATVCPCRRRDHRQGPEAHDLFYL